MALSPPNSHGSSSVTVTGTVAAGGSVASDLPVTDNPLLDGGRASTAVPAAVSADGDAVALWLTRNGATVADGGVAAGATDTGNPVKVGAHYYSTVPTLVDGQRGDLQVGSRGALRVTIQKDNGTPVVDVLNQSADGTVNTTVGMGVMSFPVLYNATATTFDRQRGNDPVALLASAARVAVASSADQTNYNGRGVMIVVNVTAEAGTTTLTLTIEGKDSTSSNYYTLNTGVVVYNAATDAPTVTRAVLLYPGVLTADAIGAGAANLISAKSLALPRVWRATVTPSDASSQTYSVSAVTLL